MLGGIEDLRVEADDGLRPVLEQRPRGGGEILKPGAHGKNEIGVLAHRIGGGGAGDALGSILGSALGGGGAGGGLGSILGGMLGGGGGQQGGGAGGALGNILGSILGGKK